MVKEKKYLIRDLNITVVALVALVAIVGVIAIVLNGRAATDASLSSGNGANSFGEAARLSGRSPSISPPGCTNPPGNLHDMFTDKVNGQQFLCTINGWEAIASTQPIQTVQGEKEDRLNR